MITKNLSETTTSQTNRGVNEQNVINEPRLWPKFMRIVTAGTMILGPIVTIEAVDVSPASASMTLGYPWPSDAQAPCLYGSGGGPSCENPADPLNQNDWYEWEVGGAIYRGSGGYEYRNCTDYVAWKLESLGVPASKVNGLGNGGQWYTSAPVSERSGTPQNGDAAVEPAAVGHVAFIENVNSINPTNPDLDNITVSEYNEDGTGLGGERTGTALSLKFTEFVNFGIPASPPNPTYPSGQAEMLQSNNVMEAFGPSSNGTLADYYQSSAGGLWNTGTLPGSTEGKPAVVKDPDGGLDVFILDTNDGLETYWQTAASSSINGPLSLGGSLATSPIAGVQSNGAIEAFGLDTSGQLIEYYQSAADQTFNGPVGLGGDYKGKPTVVKETNGGLEVFAIGATNDLETTYQTAAGSGMSSPISLGGSLASGPVVGTQSNGAQEVFGVASSGNLLEWYQSSAGSTFNGPANLGGDVAGTPVTVTEPTGGVDVFVRGINNDLETYSQTYAGGSYNGPTSLGGSISTDPAVAVQSNGVMEGFGVSAGGVLNDYYQTSPGSTWNTGTLPGSYAGSPFVDIETNGGMEVFIRGTSGQLYTYYQSGPSYSFNGPNSLGGSLK